MPDVARDVLDSFKVPANFPLVLPASTDPRDIANAAFASGTRYAEEAIQDATGLPIRLPTKLTAEEIGKSLGAIIPTDLEEVVDLALDIGAQIVAEGVTSLLVGAGIGSAIPGLGTVVGIAVALAFDALKDAFKKENPNLRPCETKWKCKSPPEEANAFEVIAWASHELVPLSKALAEERSRKYCGVGEAVTCESALLTMRRNAIILASGSAPHMSLPDVENARAALQGIPDGLWIWDTNPRSATEKQIVWDRYSDGLAAVQRELEERQSSLTRFLAAGLELKKLDAARADVFSRQITREIPAAARAYQAAPNDANARWLRRVVGFATALQAHRAELQQQMHAKLAAARELGERRLATDADARRRHREQMEAFLRSERQQP